MARRLSIGLVAHDRTKRHLADWVGRHAAALTEHRLFATGTTARILKEQVPELEVSALKSGPFGGDQQLGAMIAEGRLDLLIFLEDPMTPQPHDVDIRALIRLSTLYEVPVACTLATADLIVSSPLFLAPEKMPRGAPPEERFSDYSERDVP